MWLHKNEHLRFLSERGMFEHHYRGASCVAGLLSRGKSRDSVPRDDDRECLKWTAIAPSFKEILSLQRLSS